MNKLAQQQQALLDALFAWPRDIAMVKLANYLDCTGAVGLNVYQTNGQALAERSLLAAYPVLAQLLGLESFAALARAVWHTHPPASGDLARWGGALADFIGASEQLAAEPYLADVARVEWALHTCAGCADRAPEPATFELLIEEDPAALRLVLAPGCAALHSAWPVASIVTAHLCVNRPGLPSADNLVQARVRAESQPDLFAVGHKVRAGVAETAVVWRAGHQPQVREAVPGEADLLAALLQGLALDAAVQRATALDFNAWLPMAVQTGLLLAAELIAACDAAPPPAKA